MNLSKWETSTITRKKWAYSDDSIITPNKRKVVPKRKLYEVLSLAHTRTAHRGRHITSKWINDNYSEVNVKVITIFVALCPIHAEQQSVTSRIKLVNKPIQSPTFLSLVEIDLMDFRNCARDCTNNHTWPMNIPDHHIKYVHVSPLTDNSANEVLRAFNNYCYTYGFPKKILTDYGKEFKNKKMKAYCQENGIQNAHGSPRTPTTQGLVERSNRSWKEDTRALIMSTSSENVKKWCEKVAQAAYTRSISYHRAIKITPYGDMVSIKIDRVDKTLPLHSNLLLGKIEEIVNSYACILTKFGGNTLISPTRLYPCSVTTQNIKLDYNTELTFSAACKKLCNIFT